MDLLNQFFIEKGSSLSTQRHYSASAKIYEELCGKTITELIHEADEEEEAGIRWKKRKLKTYLINFRNHLYANKSEGTAKQYLTDIKTLYRHFEIELQPLPSFNSKQIDKTYVMTYDDIVTKEQLIDAYHEATNVVKCIILFGSSSGLSKIDFLNLTVGDFIEACNVKNDDLYNQLIEIKNEYPLIPCFKGDRKKTGKGYITFCSPEATNHIVQYLLGRNAEIKIAYDKGDSIESQLNYDDKLFDISNSHLDYVLRKINNKLQFGTAGKLNIFRCHQLRKYHATTLINVENGFTVEEIDTLQGRSQDMTHRAYFHNSRDKLYKKYEANVDELMLFTSIHEIDKEAYHKLEKENSFYKKEIVKNEIKIDEQQKAIDKIISNQKELERLLGIE